MAKIQEMVEITQTVDKDNNVIATKETRKTRKVKPLGEPDYIKLYTKVWCEFNDIPTAYRNLFLELAMRMSYSNSSDLEHSQLVYTGKPFSDAICKSLGWQYRMFQKGITVLNRCGAIRRVTRGVYQINPSYAGRGGWRYNPQLKQGGIENLVATFDFKNGTVDASFVWADTEESEYGHEQTEVGTQVILGHEEE